MFTHFSASSDDTTRSRIDELFKLTKVEFADNLTQTPLLDYQTIAVAYQYLSKRCIIGDTVGAGKTLTAVAAAMLAKHRDDAKRVLIVVQPSHVGYWRDVIKDETFIRPLVIMGTRQSRIKKISRVKDNFFNLSYYPLILKDIKEYLQYTYDLLIMDEATAIKNRETQTSHCMKALADRSKAVMLLTATPLQNHIGELFSLMEAVDPTIFGDYQEFVHEHCIEEVQRIRRRGRVFIIRKIVGTNANSVPIIIDKIKYNCLARTREQLGIQLPPIVYHDRWLNMTVAQRRKYHEIEEGVLAAGDTFKYVDLLARFVYQLQICDSATLIDPEIVEESPKIAELRRLLAGEYSGEKVVIFSMFRKTVNLIEKALADDSITYLKITGKEHIRDREGIRRKFSDDPNIKVMLITTAAEMGSNLQAAGVMIIVSRLFNPQRMRQVVGRIYRRGQKRDAVVIVNLIMRDSIEARVLAILKRKAELYDAIFGKGRKTELGRQILKQLIEGDDFGIKDESDVPDE